MSYVQVARYLGATDEAIDEATNLRPRPQPIDLHLKARENGRFSQVVEKEQEAVAVGDAVALLRQPNTAQAPWWLSKVEIPADGMYRIRGRMFGLIWDRGQALPADRIHVVTYQAFQGTTKRDLAVFDIGKSSDDASVHDFTAYLRRGDEIQIWFETLDDRNKQKTPINEYTAPGVAIDWFEIQGPILPQWPSESHHRLFGDLPIQEWTPETGLQQPPLPMTVSGVGKRARIEPINLKYQKLLHVVSREPKKDAQRLLTDFA